MIKQSIEIKWFVNINGNIINYDEIAHINYDFEIELNYHKNADW